MKKTLSTLLILFAANSYSHAATLEDRVSELEANQSLNIFRFSGVLINRFDMVTKKPDAPTATNFEETVEVNRLKFAFNADADVSPKLKVFTTMTTSKTWNLFARQNDSQLLGPSYHKELGGNMAFRDSEVVLEKAYFDYNMGFAPLVFSVGRLPTFFGSPTHYWDQRARLGTYPKLAYSAVLDGAALTYKVGLPEGNSLALRTLYNPFGHRNFSGVSNPRYNGGTVIGESQTSGLAFMLDYTRQGTTIFDELNFIVQYFDLGALRIEDLPPTPAFNSLVQSNVTLAHQFLTFHLEAADIGQSGLSLAASYLHTKTQTQGQFSLTAGNPLGAPAGTPIGTYLGSGTGADISGGIMLLSAAYRLPLPGMNNPVLGAEYQKGDKESVFYDYVTEDLTGFYANRGTGWHAYYSQIIEDNFTLRLGYRAQQRDHEIPTGGAGAINDTKTKLNTAYANLRVDF